MILDRGVCTPTGKMDTEDISQDNGLQGDAARDEGRRHVDNLICALEFSITRAP
jgi:hypothetical protein